MQLNLIKALSITHAALEEFVAAAHVPLKLTVKRTAAVINAAT
jgi:hypothetical protein